MSEIAETAKTADGTIRLWLAAAGSTCVLIGGELIVLYGSYLGGFALLVLSVFFYWSQYKWVWIKTKISERSLSTINMVATDARWWFGLLGIFLLAAIFSPLVEQHRWPFFDWFQTPTSREQQVADEIAKATAPLNAQIAMLKQQLRDAQQTRQAPAGPPLQTTPQLPQTKLSSEEVATKISIWDSVINSNLHTLVDDFNALDLAQSRWPRLVNTPDGRRQLYQDITNAVAAYAAASKDLDILRSEYPNYQDVADALAQPHRSDLERAASNFADAISKVPQDPPPNFEVQLRPLAGALRREMDATQSWLHTLGVTANQNHKALSEEK